MLDEDLRGFLEDFDVGGMVDGQPFLAARDMPDEIHGMGGTNSQSTGYEILICLLYTSPSPRDQRGSRMPSSA